MLNRPRKILLAIVMVVVVAASLIAGYHYYIQATRVQLRIFAASSLTNLFREYKLRFESQHNVEIILNLENSNTLREQITSGSPCDVFVSASITEMVAKSGVMV